MVQYSSAVSDGLVIHDKKAPVVTLAGPKLRVAVVPNQGGEVASLKVLHKGNWVETLHRALDYADLKDEWRGRAPLQWPAVGRNCVPEELDKKITDPTMGSWRCEGKRYPIPILGFAQYMAFELLAHGSSANSAWAECRITSNDYSRQYYPFEFELIYRHIVEANNLRSRVIVRSRETKRIMPFSLGNHITFHLPFSPAGSFEECVFTSPTTHHLELNSQDLLSGRCLPKDLRNGAKLCDKELWNMALTGYTRENAAVELRDPSAFGFRISQSEITNIPPFDKLMAPSNVEGHSAFLPAAPCGGLARPPSGGLARPPSGGPHFSDADIHFILSAERPFNSFCPEPWIGEPNSLNSGKGVVKLGPGEEFTWEMGVTLTAGGV